MIQSKANPYCRRNSVEAVPLLRLPGDVRVDCVKQVQREGHPGGGIYVPGGAVSRIFLEKAQPSGLRIGHYYRALKDATLAN